MGGRREESDRADREALDAAAAGMRRGDMSAWAGWRPEFITFEDILSQWRDVVLRLGSPGYPGRINVYVNIPVCASFCRYCMYWKTRADQVSIPAYVDYLVSVIDAWNKAAGRQDAVNCYVGGGTASILPAAGLAKVVNALGRAFSFSNERSFEANPGSFDRHKLETVAAGGFNRLSMGVQSLDRGVLEAVGRKNPSPDKLKGLVAAARGLGMYVNVDLICGLPGQTPDSLWNDLAAVSGMSPDTITVYRFQPIFDMNTPPDPRMLESRFARELASRMNSSGQVQWSFDIRGDGHALFMIATRADSISPYDQGRVYTFMDYQDRQMIGIGPGARSHLFGRSWFTEVTPMDSVRGDRAPVFWGTRLSPGEEALTRVRADLSSAGQSWFGPVSDMAGVDAEGLVKGLTDWSRMSGVVRVSNEFIEIASGADPEARTAVLDILMPPGPVDDEASIRAAIGTARALGPLVPPVVREGIFRRRAAFLAQKSQPDQAVCARVRAWRMMTGLDGDDVTVSGARLVGAARDEVVFISPGSDVGLRVRVTQPSGEDCFFRSRHFMVSYAKDGEPLNDGDAAVLEELRRITLLRDP